MREHPNPSSTPSHAPASRADAAMYVRMMIPLLIIAVIGWAVFATLFRTLWTPGFMPGSSLLMYGVWLSLGTLGFIISVFGAIRVFRVPTRWRMDAAVALVAPALCLDAAATLFFEAWFPDTTFADVRIYPALILASVGMMLLFVMGVTRAHLVRDAEQELGS